MRKCKACPFSDPCPNLARFILAEGDITQALIRHVRNDTSKLPLSQDDWMHSLDNAYWTHDGPFINRATLKEGDVKIDRLFLSIDSANFEDNLELENADVPEVEDNRAFFRNLTKPCGVTVPIHQHDRWAVAITLASALLFQASKSWPMPLPKPANDNIKLNGRPYICPHTLGHANDNNSKGWPIK